MKHTVPKRRWLQDDWLKEWISAREPPADGPVYGVKPDGTKYVRGWLRNGKRHGLWTEHHPKGGRTESEYLDGVRHGVEAAWHPDGRTKFLGQYEDGEMSGAWTSWHDGGAVMDRDLSSCQSRTGLQVELGR